MAITGRASRVIILIISAITIGLVVFFFFSSKNKVRTLSEFEEPLDTLCVLQDVTLVNYLGDTLDDSDLEKGITLLAFAESDMILLGEDSAWVADLHRLQEEFSVDNSYSKENTVTIAVLFPLLFSHENDTLKAWAKKNSFVPTRIKLLSASAEQNAFLLDEFGISPNEIPSSPVWYMIDPKGMVRGESDKFAYSDWSRFNRDFSKLDREYKKGR